MRIHADRRPPRFLLTVAAMLTILLSPQPTRADDPMLAIRRQGGESALYYVAQIERVVFAGDMLAVTAAGGTESYALETISQIEFLWGFSGIDNPEATPALLKAVHLFQNLPNPFSPETRIEYELPQAGQVELGIYTVSGRLVRSLVKEHRAVGRHSVRWDRRDDTGRLAAGGVYFYSLTAPRIKESRRMILLP